MTEQMQSFHIRYSVGAASLVANELLAVERDGLAAAAVSLSR
jgi:hypothetical protein